MSLYDQLLSTMFYFGLYFSPQQNNHFDHSHLLGNILEDILNWLICINISVKCLDTISSYIMQVTLYPFSPAVIEARTDVNRCARDSLLSEAGHLTVTADKHLFWVQITLQ